MGYRIIIALYHERDLFHLCYQYNFDTYLPRFQKMFSSFCHFHENLSRTVQLDHQINVDQFSDNLWLHIGSNS